MRNYLFIVLFAFAVCGCSTFNPDTGQKEFDPVKTHKVRAALKPAISTVVLGTIIHNPEAREPFGKAAVHICKMRDSGEVNLTQLKEAVNSELAPLLRNDLVVAGTINTVFSLIEINFADRFRADLPEEEFVWNMLDVLCEAITQAVAQSEPDPDSGEN